MKKIKFISAALVALLLLSGCSDAKKASIDNSGDSTQKNALIQQLETKHFKFYSKDKDKQCLKDLSNALEDNYTRIINDLHTSLNEKIDVNIYSDLNTYHKAADRPDAPSWFVGNAVPGSNSIQMVNPSNADGRPYSDFMKVIIHEFTHVVIMNINPDVYNIPSWLNEGVAVFEAKQDEGTEQVILKAKSSNKFPSLEDLETNVSAFGNNGGYQFSYSIIQYIVKNYGYDKLIALIKSPTDFDKILGVSKDDFQKEWIAKSS